MSKDELDFAAMMASMGVRRLDEGAGKPRGPKKKTKKKATRAPQAAPPAAARSAAPVRTAPGPAPAGRRQPAAAPAPRAPRGSAPGRSAGRSLSPARMELRLAEAEAATRAALAARDAARAELAAARDELVAAEAELEARDEALAALDQSKRAVQRRLSAVQQELGTPPSLHDRLHARGLRGESEAVMLVRALDAAGRLPALLGLLAEGADGGLDDFLDDKVALLGDCEACPVPEGRAVLRVPRPRCEVCGGSDITREVRGLESDLLLHGMRRITIVGGSPKYRRQLKLLFTDRRLRLRLQPGDGRRTARQARQDIESSDVLVIWGATILDHAVSELYTVRPDDRVQLVRVAVRGIGRMLQDVRRAIHASA